MAKEVMLEILGTLVAYMIIIKEIYTFFILKTCDLQANEKQMESMKKEEEAKKADSFVR